MNNERGSILLAALSLVLLVGVSAGSVWFWLRADLRSIGQGRATLQALYTAEAGLLGAANSLSPRLEPLPSDAALMLLAEAILVEFPGPPHGFRLSSWRSDRSADGSRQVSVVAESEAVGGAGRALEGVLVRAREPYAPASLLIVTGDLRVFPGEAPEFSASGDPVIEVIGDSDVAPLAAGNHEAARALEFLERRGLLALRGEGGVMTARPIPVDLFLAEGQREAVSSGFRGFRSSPSEVLYLRGGIVEDLQGDGLLVVVGDLRLEGVVDFAGVILVGGTLELSTSACSIRGFVQVHALHASSPCTFRRDSAAVAGADALQALPREARLRAAIAAVRR